MSVSVAEILVHLRCKWVSDLVLQPTSPLTGGSPVHTELSEKLRPRWAVFHRVGPVECVLLLLFLVVCVAPKRSGCS